MALCVGVAAAGFLGLVPSSARAGGDLRACAHTVLPRDWVVRENARPGFAGWHPRTRSHAPDVALYLSDPSLVCGDALVVHLGGSAAPAAHVQVVRMGWYSGAGARLVWTSPPVSVPQSRVPLPVDHVQPGAAWRAQVAVHLTSGWTPGLYLAEAVVRGEVTSTAPFVVRNVAAPSPLVAIDSNLTWAAYTHTGGASLYLGPVRLGTTRLQSYAGRAYTVSLDRPTNDPAPLLYDVPLAALAERAGIAVDHVLDTDLDSRPGLLDGRAGVVLPGHSEYWTHTAYDALVAAEARGVNVLDLGANALYWQARVSYDPFGAPHSMTVFREVGLDPLSASQPELTTVRWQYWPLERPAAAQVGEPSSGLDARGGLVVVNAPGWLGMSDGTVLPGAVGGEVDGLRYGTGGAPLNVQAVTVGLLRGTGTTVVSSSYFSAPSGAGVFDAGVTTWLCRAMSSCPNQPVPALTSQLLRQLTVRLLLDFSHPRWGATHPSHLAVPPPARVLRLTLPAAAIGEYGTS